MYTYFKVCDSSPIRRKHGHVSVNWLQCKQIHPNSASVHQMNACNIPMQGFRINHFSLSPIPSFSRILHASYACITSPWASPAASPSAFDIMVRRRLQKHSPWNQNTFVDSSHLAYSSLQSNVKLSAASHNVGYSDFPNSKQGRLIRNPPSGFGRVLATCIRMSYKCALSLTAQNV